MVLLVKLGKLRGGVFEGSNVFGFRYIVFEVI